LQNHPNSRENKFRQSDIHNLARKQNRPLSVDPVLIKPAWKA